MGESNYDKTMARIYVQRNNFVRQTGLQPNVVIINRKDYYDLLESGNIINNAFNTVLGMKLEVKETWNIQVGYVMEEYKEG